MTIGANNDELIIARGPFGHFVFYKRAYEDVPEPKFWHSESSSIDSVVSELWMLYDQIVLVSAQKPAWGRVRYQYVEGSLPDNPLYGRQASVLGELATHYGRAARPCSYVLFGRAGTGKSSFAKRFFDNDKVLQVEAKSLEHLSVADVVFLARNLRPKFVMIDDIDKMQFGNATATLLEVIRRLKADVGCSVVMTANQIGGFDEGLLRPGRVDRFVEFPLPDSAERRTVLEQYLLHPGLVLDDQLITASDGLSHDYLRDAADRINRGESLKMVSETLRRSAEWLKDKDGPSAPK